MSKSTFRVVFLVVIGAAMLLPGQVMAGDFPAGPADDMTSSLGTFTVLVRPKFRPMMIGMPGYNAATYKFTSPLLYDPATVIGRSAIHLDGDAADTGGIPVGTAGTIVKDGDFSLMPPGFQGPPGTREVHTEVRALKMDNGACPGPGCFAVRAGVHAPMQPVSPGEVESLNVAPFDFPAESFFDVFVEIDAGGLGVLYNEPTDPLLVMNSSLTDPPGFPPRLVYIHGNTAPAWIAFRGSGPGWHATERFGALTLAGHGISFTDSSMDRQEFQSIYESLPEIPVPPGFMPEPSSFALALIGIAGLMSGARRRRAVV